MKFLKSNFYKIVLVILVIIASAPLYVSISKMEEFHLFKVFKSHYFDAYLDTIYIFVADDNPNTLKLAKAIASKSSIPCEVIPFNSPVQNIQKCSSVAYFISYAHGDFPYFQNYIISSAQRNSYSYGRMPSFEPLKEYILSAVFLNPFTINRLSTQVADALAINFSCNRSKNAIKLPEAKLSSKQISPLECNKLKNFQNLFNGYYLDIYQNSGYYFEITDLQEDLTVLKELFSQKGMFLTKSNANLWEFTHGKDYNNKATVLFLDGKKSDYSNRCVKNNIGLIVNSHPLGMAQKVDKNYIDMLKKREPLLYGLLFYDPFSTTKEEKELIFNVIYNTKDIPSTYLINFLQKLRSDLDNKSLYQELLTNFCKNIPNYTNAQKMNYLPALYWSNHSDPVYKNIVLENSQEFNSIVNIEGEYSKYFEIPIENSYDFYKSITLNYTINEITYSQLLPFYLFKNREGKYQSNFAIGSKSKVTEQFAQEYQRQIISLDSHSSSTRYGTLRPEIFSDETMPTNAIEVTSYIDLSQKIIRIKIKTQLLSKKIADFLKDFTLLNQNKISETKLKESLHKLQDLSNYIDYVLQVYKKYPHLVADEVKTFTITAPTTANNLCHQQFILPLSTLDKWQFLAKFQFPNLQQKEIVIPFAIRKSNDYYLYNIANTGEVFRHKSKNELLMFFYSALGYQKRFERTLLTETKKEEIKSNPNDFLNIGEVAIFIYFDFNAKQFVINVYRINL